MVKKKLLVKIFLKKNFHKTINKNKKNNIQKIYIA